MALYSDAHVARLRIVGQLLERGYTLSNIGELLGAWESGQNVGDLLGLEAVLAAPWSDETPTIMTIEELASLFGFGDEEPDAQAIELALEQGIFEADGDTFLVRKPRILHAGAELVAAGIPLTAVLALGARLREDMDRVARSFVELVADACLRPGGGSDPRRRRCHASPRSCADCVRWPGRRWTPSWLMPWVATCRPSCAIGSTECSRT